VQAKLEGDLVSAVTALETFTDAATMANMVIVCLSIKSEHPQWPINATHLFFDNRKLNLERYFHKNEQEYRNFIKSFMSDNRLSLAKRGRLGNKFLYASANGEDNDLILSRHEWQEIVNDLFRQFLDEQPTDFEKVWEFYLFNDYKRENHYIIIYPPSGVLLRGYVLSAPPALEAFTRKMIDPAREADRGYYRLFPETIQAVFREVPAFLELLEQRVFSDPAAEKARKAVLAHITSFMQNKRPFLLEESERPDKT
jgi:hypothetical protein